MLYQPCGKIRVVFILNVIKKQRGKVFMKKFISKIKRVVLQVKHILNSIISSKVFKALILCIAFLLIPPVVNWTIRAEAPIFPSFFNFITSENESAWIGFLGAIIGGAITLIGVAWTIIDQNKKRAEDIKDMSRPIIVSTKCDYEKVKNIKNDTSGTKIIECILPVKNAGSGMLYNPNLYNIVCKIDDVLIESVNLSIPMASHLDINDSLRYDVMVSIKPEMLQKLYARLKGRGNTLILNMVLHIGGDDMYGRTTITELVYRLNIIFASEKEIELGITTGNLTSKVIFSKKDIDRVKRNRNYKYFRH